MNVPPLQKWRITDTILTLVILSPILYFLYYSISHLDYHWDWLAPLSYFIQFNDDTWRFGFLAEGLFMSIRLLIFSGIIALGLGLMLAVLRLSPIAALRMLSRAYIELLRHLPPLVFLFIAYFLISLQWLQGAWVYALMDIIDNPVGRVVFGDPSRIHGLLAGGICLALFEAAFFAEILRAGILGVDSGQKEAGFSLGFSKWGALRHIMLPQALRKIASPLVGQGILLVKDSAILSLIAVQELTFVAQETAVSTGTIFETWILAACMYFCICYPMARWSKRLKTHQ